MSKVLRLRNATLVTALSLAALMLLLALGSREAGAVPFIPSAAAVVPITGAGAASSVTQSSGLAGDFPSSLSAFTPGDWGVAAGGAINHGDRTGLSSSTTTLGILNGPCLIPIPIAGLPVINASLKTSNVLVTAPNFANYIVDTTGPGFVGGPNGIPDGADNFSDLLLALVPAPPVQNSYTQLPNFLGTGTNVTVNVATYSPGLLAPAALGYATLTVIHNFSPALPAVPSIITDTCAFSSSLLTFATSTPGPGLPPVAGFSPAYPPITAGGSSVRTNPAAPGTKLFFTVIGGDRDADADGIPNSDDTCPFTTNVGSPYVPGSGDAGEVPGDGIDAACDNTGVITDVPGFPWDATSPCRVGAGDNILGLSCDGDGFPNRNDNCPQHANGGAPNIFTGAPTLPQSPDSEASLPPMVDGGPQTDGIGTACDLNPTVADGHFHKALLMRPVCITGGPFADGDGDGWCDATEGALGNADLTGTPENIAVPTTCDNGADDDLDGATDLADSGCQLPLHDLAIRKVNGDTVAGGASECQPAAPTGCGYNLILRNNSSTDQSGTVGVLVDPIFGAGCSGPTVQLHGGSASPVLTGSGPINIDGDTNVEFLLKASVTIPAGGQATVNVGVVYPTCGPTVGTPADYVILADLCHVGDIAPLGLFGAAACDGSSDGGLDTSVANDAPVTKIINDANR